MKERRADVYVDTAKMGQYTMDNNKSIYVILLHLFDEHILEHACRVMYSFLHAKNQIMYM